MYLYHYRSIKSAVAEIENTSFRMANRTELNDPIEGYLNVYWEGDKPAWEGLLRNYICSLYSSLDFCLNGYKDLKSYTVIPDLASLSNVSFKQECDDISKEFLYHPDVELVSDYLSEAGKMSRTKIKYWLIMLHSLAFYICIQKFIQIGVLDKYTSVPDSEKHDLIVRIISSHDESIAEQFAFDYANRLISGNARILAGLVGGKKKEQGNPNWILLRFDYPEMYVNRLTDLIYPDIFVTSFSATDVNSVM